ncbi:hypothetical protein [Corynebacterium crudilactis]|uniref:hypothetical protein n=1 Tax=Corynebacterium crudilactis TaxID=1652495 RepID=UPI0012FD1482|nr:hypothetical protein [Corynebacterium crudilactis]
MRDFSQRSSTCLIFLDNATERLDEELWRQVATPVFTHAAHCFRAESVWAPHVKIDIHKKSDGAVHGYVTGYVSHVAHDGTIDLHTRTGLQTIQVGEVHSVEFSTTTINQERAHEALNRMLRYVATPTTYKETVSGDAYIHYDGAPGVKVTTDDMARGLERFVVSPQFTQVTHAHRAVFEYLFDFNLSYPPVEDALAFAVLSHAIDHIQERDTPRA